MIITQVMSMPLFRTPPLFWPKLRGVPLE